MDREKLNEFYKTPVNRRLKYWALGVMVVVMALMIASAFVLDSGNWWLFHLMRGCIGLFVIFFVVLVGILVYRVNSAYFRQEKHKK